MQAIKSLLLSEAQGRIGNFMDDFLQTPGSVMFEEYTRLDFWDGLVNLRISILGRLRIEKFPLDI